MIAYTNRNGRLSIDVGERFRIVRRPPVDRDRPPDVHVHGVTRLRGSVLLERIAESDQAASRRPASPVRTLGAILVAVAAAGTARIRSTPTMIEPGTYRLGVRFRGRTVMTGPALTVPDLTAPPRVLRGLAGRLKRGLRTTVSRTIRR